MGIAAYSFFMGNAGFISSTVVLGQGLGILGFGGCATNLGVHFPGVKGRLGLGSRICPGSPMYLLVHELHRKLSKGLLLRFTTGPRFLSDPRIIRVPFFLVFGFKETPPPKKKN